MKRFTFTDEQLQLIKYALLQQDLREVQVGVDLSLPANRQYLNLLAWITSQEIDRERQKVKLCK